MCYDDCVCSLVRSWHVAMFVYTVVSKYVEVDPRHCAGVIPGLKINQLCGRKIGSTDVEAVCKAGHGGTNCDGMLQHTH